MISKRTITFFSTILTILTAAGLFFYISTHPPLAKVVHYHAGFQVWSDGKLQDFSGPQYMNIEPCKNEEKEERTPAHEQLEKAHLHDGIGDVVHVHRDNATWADLFKNLHYTFPKDKSLEVFVNGKKDENIFQQKIQPYESVVFIIGKHGNPQQYIQNQVQKSEILKVEKMKESCGI